MNKFYMISNQTPSQMMGFVIKTRNKTIVIDGGCLGDEEQLVNLLKEISKGYVDAWFFTHPHQDHIGCFYNVRHKYKEIKVGKVYHHFPDLDTLLSYGSRNTCEIGLWKEIESWAKNLDVYYFSSGESFSFDDLTLTVLRVYNPNITRDFVNNSSSVFRIENKNKSFLILGDLSVEGGAELLKNCQLELLQTDYTQMAHHGQNGVNREFYERIKPKRCIWTTPEWLYNNDLGNGFDTGPYKTVQTREWMDELEAIEHFIEKDGMQTIEF